MSRPEHVKAPEDFYDEGEAGRYAVSSRMNAVQREIAERALELLNLPKEAGPGLILDVGCGTGLSGEVVGSHGHAWVGCDISIPMLRHAAMQVNHGAGFPPTAASTSASAASDEPKQPLREYGFEPDDADYYDYDNEDAEEEDEEDDDEDEADGEETPPGPGDVIAKDMGQGLGFRPNTFDGCVSISAVQWLCYAHKGQESPAKRLRAFFSSLYACLRRGARAAIQLYPETPEQMEMISNAAMAAGFSGGVVVDYPNSSKAKKYYLVLFAGQADKPGGGKQKQELPAARGVSAAATSVAYESSRHGLHNSHKRGRGSRGDADHPRKKSKEWIEHKKVVQRVRGEDVRPDSKYTGRKRTGSRKF